MEKIFRKHLGKHILHSECYHAENDNCNSCNHNIKENSNEDKIELKRLARIKEKPPRDEERIEGIKQAIPQVLNLHPSFWNTYCFATWQLVRLTGRYQMDVGDRDRINQSLLELVTLVLQGA